MIENEINMYDCFSDGEEYICWNLCQTKVKIVFKIDPLAYRIDDIKSQKVLFIYNCIILVMYGKLFLLCK